MSVIRDWDCLNSSSRIEFWVITDCYSVQRRMQLTVITSFFFIEKHWIGIKLTNGQVEMLTSFSSRNSAPTKVIGTVLLLFVATWDLGERFSFSCRWNIAKVSPCLARSLRWSILIELILDVFAKVSLPNPHTPHHEKFSHLLTFFIRIIFKFKAFQCMNLLYAWDLCFCWWANKILSEDCRLYQMRRKKIKNNFRVARNYFTGWNEK